MKNKKKSGFKLLTYLVLFVLLAIGLIALVDSAFFKVKKVSCRIQNTAAICPHELWMETMSLGIGKNIVFLSTRKLSEDVQKTNAFLKEVLVKKAFPDTLVFELEGRDSQVVVVDKEQKNFLLVDEEGVILEKTKNADLPIISVDYPINLKVGDQLKENELLWVIKLIKRLKLQLFSPETIKIVSPRQIEINLKEKLLVIFSSLKEAEIQLDSLQLIFSRAKIEGKLPKRVDLRFDKPVVVYE